MTCVTFRSLSLRCDRDVRSLDVAAVSRDPAIRSELARAFDSAPATWRINLYESPPAQADVVVLGPDVSGDGISFDPVQPERMLEEIAERAVTSNLIAVTSPGGGTGLTSVALHVAKVAAESHRTCFLETRPGGVGLRLSLPDSVPTWTDAAENQPSVPVAGGFRAFLAPSEPMDPHRVVDHVTDTFDIVLAEVPMLDRALLARARCAVLVMPPTIPGAVRARAVLQAAPSTRWAIVTNRLGPGGETTTAALERILDARIAVELPTCAALRDAEDDGRLLSSPFHAWWRAVRRLWRALENA